ncbi:MAG: IS256 family transposase [Anaerolineales bacterium]|nr:IS256 family transposase [Anaerolineales bacterium]
MAPKQQNTTVEALSQSDFQSLLQEQVRMAVRLTLVTILEAEVSALIGALPYQRTSERRDYRNGHYTRDLDTTVGLLEDLPVPRTRNGHQTQVFEKYRRRRAELDDAIGDMFIGGVSTRKTGEVVESLTGSKPSPSTVSRVFHTLEGEFETWKTRSLEERYEYAFADGTYFTVIYDGEGHKMPILAVIGINTTGEREVLGFTIGDRENQQAWEDLFDDLKARGVREVGLWITDGNQAMINALEAKFPDSPRQRCVKHKMDNVLSYLPKKQRDAVRLELRAIFYQKDREAAEQEIAAFSEKFEPIYPTAVACLRRDLDACLTFYAFPKAHWKTIRTTNVIERLYNEVKRRTKKMAAAFRNENSCLLMFYAIVRSMKFRRISMPKTAA